MREIHNPVTTLNEKIGDRISTFIKQAPLMKPFARQNWLIHGDTKRFHLVTQKIHYQMIRQHGSLGQKKKRYVDSMKNTHYLLLM